MRSNRKRARALRQARAAGRRMGLTEAASTVLNQLRFYPVDVFPTPPRGKHGKTVDSCSAAALRAMLPNLARTLQSEAQALPRRSNP